MDYKKITIIGFILMCIAQLFVPAKMIMGKEEVLQKGTAFKFRTEPVDPNDPFRGKYITLNYKDTEFAVDNKDNFNTAKSIFVELETDTEGFAKIKNVSTIPPEHPHFFTAKHSYITERVDGTSINIRFPFDRFYMEESKAPIAESIYRDFNRDSSIITYALVYINNGDAVLEDVIMDGISIKDQVEMQMDDK